MSKRPKLKIELTRIDYLIESIGLIGLVILVILPVYFYHELPIQIPKHFNLLGEVDAYGNRNIIWLLPAIGLFFYIGFTFLAKIPFAYNYPVKITEENAEKMYTLGAKTIRILKVTIILSFTFLNYKTITIALNHSTEIGKFYLPVFLIVIIAYLATMIYKMIKAR